jgi:hypothetical protein
VTYPAYPTTTVEAREQIAAARQAIKEGREITGESLIVIQAILDKIDESYEYLGEGKSMLETVLGIQPETEIEIDEEMPAEEPIIEDASPRSISLRLAKAIVNNTK